MRVLVTSTPGVGHISPMAPVVRAIAAAGHDVTWATAPQGAAYVERLGFRAAIAGLDTDVRHSAGLQRAPDVRDLPPRRRRARIGPVVFGEVAAPAMASDLRPLIERGRFDLVVTEPLECAAPPLATARGLPYAVVGFGAALPDEVVGGLAVAVAPLWAAEGLDAPPDAGLYRHLYVHPFPPSLGGPPTGCPVVLVAPCPPADPGEPPPWLRELGSARPLVYATFGTELLPGALSPWGRCIEALGELDVDAVVTIGPRVDAADLPAAPGNVRVERFVPQDLLLARASVVVSHGGSGTLLGATARAVPHVVVPLGADQFENAEAATAAGLGVELDAATLDGRSLSAAVHRVMDEPSFSQAAARVAAELAAMPPPGAAAARIVALVGD